MEQRNLGSGGPTVGALGLGCMAMTGGTYVAASQREARATLLAAVEAGVTLLDTADVYGPFANEELMGDVLRSVRDDVAIATKFGNEVLGDGTVRLNGRPDYVRDAVEGSLQRLKTDVVDLYYLHRVDPDVPIEETVGAMAGLVDEGKVRFLGLSEVSASTIRRAHAVHPIAAVQTEYSLWTRHVETEILPTMRELGVGLVPYSPLGRGFLTGRVRSLDDLPQNDWRRDNPRFSGDNLTKNLTIVDAVDRLAAELGHTPAQVALAWVLTKGDDVVPIPGTTRRKHLLENLGAVDVVLDSAAMAHLDQLTLTHGVAGERYDASGMGSVQM